jgi:transposase
VAGARIAWVGIDAGKQAHHAAAVDEQGRLLWSVKVPNDQAAIEQVLARAVDTAVEVRWAVDLTSPGSALLLAVLVAARQPVVYVPGRMVNRMSGAFPGEGKTDPKDAQVIAETARLRRDLVELSTPDELAVELSRLVAARADLAADWVRGVNRLRDLLTAVFPGLEQAFNYCTRSALILVAGYCTPTAIRDAGVEGLTAYLRQNGAWKPGIRTMVAKATAAAAGQTVVLPAEALTASLVMRQARKLLDLDQEMKDTDREITDRFRQHPQAHIIESLPGMGPILGAEFIAATGGNLTAFASPAKLAAYAGLAPVPSDSGRRTGRLHRPRRYHRRLRHVFYMAAFCSLKAGGPSKQFYDRKRAERQRHSQAVIALARRLVDVLWALLRDNRVFTPAPPNPTPTT